MGRRTGCYPLRRSHSSGIRYAGTACHQFSGGRDQSSRGPENPGSIGRRRPEETRGRAEQEPGSKSAEYLCVRAGNRASAGSTGDAADRSDQGHLAISRIVEWEIEETAREQHALQAVQQRPECRGHAGSDRRGPGARGKRYSHARAEPAGKAQRGDDHEQAIRQRYRTLQRIEGHPLTPKTRVLLGVTGGIAAYKSPDLVRRLIERGADVQVVMTGAAQRFVSPMSFQAVSGRPARSDLWDDAAEAAMGHIELARWAQVVLIAPASADFIARLAGGRADDLLSTLCLATEAPIVLAPAMNRVMWPTQATQANVETLVSRGIRILGPASGNQACGEVGAGRMWEPVELAERLLEPPVNAGLLAGLNVLITAGPTREHLDPVRYLTNRSSGKMGFAVAAAAREAGAHVTIVTGPVQLPTPTGITRINVESARDMYAAVHRQVADADIFIAAAAVADFQPVAVAKQKIKKQGVSVKLDLEPAPDIIKSVADMAKRPYVVGFAAETNDVEENARIKLKRKKLDMIAANQVGDGIAFDCDDNALTVIWPGGKVEVARGPKIEVARQLLALTAQRLPPPDGSPRRGPRKRRIAALPRDRVRARRVRR